MIRMLCLITALVALASCCVASDGVLVEDRVVNLPQDQGKWYVSVVGDGARFNEISGWFETNADLKRLKSQVKFCQVASNTAIYKERYAPNVSGLPTVRLQKADGTVVYEASGKSIPMTPESLYTSIADTSATAQGIRPILPWRRQMEDKCGPNGCPRPTPTPKPVPDLDPAPDPIDDGGKPDLVAPDEKSGLAKLIGMLILSALAGSTIGGVVAWKKAYGKQ